MCIRDRVASFRFAEKQREKIYVLDGGKSLMLALSPDKRIIVILTLLLFFSVLSLYFTVSSIYRFGKGAGERMQIRHIERLELELRQRQEADRDVYKRQIKVYNKFSSGDPDTSKTAASWFGACIFLIVAATILRSFFL